MITKMHRFVLPLRRLHAPKMNHFAGLCRTTLHETSTLRRSTVRFNHDDVPRDYTAIQGGTLKWFGRIFVVIMGGSILYEVYNSITDENRNRPRTKTEARIYSYLKAYHEYPAVYTLICTNVVFFLIGRLVPHFAHKHLLLSLENISAGRYHTILTSSFFHVGSIHLFVNMYVLHSFRGIEWELGDSRFLALYFVSALSSGLLSLANKRIRSITIASMGASGALYGIVGTFVLLNPNSRLSIVFIPSSWLNFKASSLLPFVALFDFLGLFYKKSMLDHAGHLGGLIAGIVMFYYFIRQANMETRIEEFSNRRQRYKGEVKGLKTKHGKGDAILHFPDGDVILKGEFDNGMLVRGEIINKRSSSGPTIYSKGEFVGLKLRKGVIEQDDAILEGTFDNNTKLHGSNCKVIIKEPRIVVSGNFQHGTLVGTGQIDYSDGSRFISDHFGEAQFIQGTLITPDGQKKEGIFDPFPPGYR